MSLDLEHIEKPVRKMRKFLKKSPSRPTIDQIHDLRTNSRRFEANIEVLGMSSRKKVRRVLKQIARLRKRAGKIRDTDVLTRCALSVHAELSRPMRTV